MLQHNMFALRPLCYQRQRFCCPDKILGCEFGKFQGVGVTCCGKSSSREANNRSEPCNIKRSKPDNTPVTRSAQCCRKSFMALFLVQGEGFDNPPLYHANNAISFPTAVWLRLRRARLKHNLRD
jgi:hypothetical protein